MIVQCTDKMYYDEPIWFGTLNERRWALGFQDEQPVLWVSGKRKDATIRKDAFAIGDQLRVLVGKGFYEPLLAVPPEYAAETGFRYEVKITTFLAVPSQYGLKLDSVTWNHLKYAWEVKVCPSIVWQALTGTFKWELTAWLLNTELPTHDMVRTVQMRLRKQFPGFKSLEQLREKYGEGVPVCR